MTFKLFKIWSRTVHVRQSERQITWWSKKITASGENFRLVIQHDRGRKTRLTRKPMIQAALKLQHYEGHTSLVNYVGGHFSSLSLCALLRHIWKGFESRIVWVSAHCNIVWHCWITFAGRKKDCANGNFKSSCESRFFLHCEGSPSKTLLFVCLCFFIPHNRWLGR